MDEGAQRFARARTALIIVKDDVDPAILTALTDCQLSHVAGTLRISAQVDDAAGTYALLDRIKGLGMTLVSVSVDV